MPLSSSIQKEPDNERQRIYDLAVAIERESNHRLAAMPCDVGNGIAVSDGKAIHFVEPHEIASQESLKTHVNFWLTGNLTMESQMKRSPALPTIWNRSFRGKLHDTRIQS
jgi:hypothetical protein